YLFYPGDQGHGWGNRYFHAAWVALPMLATAAMYRPASPALASLHEPNETMTGMFADPPTQLFVITCVGLMLVLGIGGRAWQIQRFLTADLNQLPQYAGTEQRVVIIDDTLSFYGRDLVQNDPWLRDTDITLYSEGAAANARMMAKAFPAMHKVFADHHGWVWSAKTLTESSNAKHP
ncbi:MAG TPA: hypothetical protein VGV09_05100, partial [Steroidobacteraceae bacterium]|nr:hypothetical protein [Steroidobacteraceae bacterium]